MKEIALDTNAAIDLLNGKPEIIKLLKEFDLIFLPITVVGELLFGEKTLTAKKKTFQISETSSRAVKFWTRIA